MWHLLRTLLGVATPEDYDCEVDVNKRALKEYVISIIKQPELY